MSSEQRTPSPRTARATAIKDAVKKLQKWGADYVRFETADVHGIAYNKVVPVRHFERFAKSGLNMCSIMITATPQSGMPAAFFKDGDVLKEAGYPDMYLFPDLSTLMMVPWAKTKVARVLCGPKWMREGKMVPYPQTREICKAMLRKLNKKHGLHLFSAFEFEWMLLKSRNGDAELREGEWVPAWKGVNIFTNLYNAKTEEFAAHSEKMMAQVGVDFNTQNVEYGNGTFEWTMMPASDIRGADTAYTFKNGMKEIAQQQDMRATFMTRPFPGDGGCNSGAHFNHSLYKIVDGKRVPAFYDPSKPNGMSDVMKNWTAGLLKHGAALQALAGPTPNCYHRVQPGSWAPATITHGIQNRTTMVREKVGSPSGTYLEYRSPSAAMNPYLVIASVVAAGMDGLETEAAKDPLYSKTAVAGNGYAEEYLKPETLLPNTLEKAIAALDADETIKRALGEQFVTWFKYVKDQELATVVEPTKELPEAEQAAAQAENARKMYLEMI